MVGIPRGSLAGVIGLAVVLGFSSSTASAPGLNLRGRVLAAGDRPLAGAQVFIYTARPREGTATVCPSCYPDCSKSRSTGRDGRFLVPGLSDSLLFRILVCAPGHVPLFVEKVDPREGPLEVRLQPRDLARVDFARALRGRVVDSAARPVVGATVTPIGFRRGDRMSFGSGPGLDPLSITDQRGAFLIATPESGGVWFVKVAGRDFAPRAFHDIPAGREDVILEVRSGAMVHGQVWHLGKPRRGVVIGLTSLEMAAGNLYLREEIATDQDGRFTFANVPAEQGLAVYGKIGSLGPDALIPHYFTSAPDDSMTDVGRLEIGPGHELSGKIVLTDGKPLPPGTRLALARTAVIGDIVQVPLEGDGTFRIQGVPTGAVNLSLRVSGYRLSPRTPGYGGYAGITLGVDRDLRLTIQLDPGGDEPGTSPPPVSP